MYLGKDQAAREPDLIVLFPDHVRYITPHNINGKADIVVEIVSPESKERDRHKKLAEYETAQIPEYWLIDPLKAQAYVYVLDAHGKYQLVPVDAQQRLQSKVLAGFVIEGSWLWRDDALEPLELLASVQQMIAASS